jgi:hypothetical protein
MTILYGQPTDAAAFRDYKNFVTGTVEFLEGPEEQVELA